MQTIQTPLKIPELHLQPDITRGLELSENMQQVLSTLTGFWRNQRILLKASPSGMLFVTNPPIEDIFTVTGNGANDTYQGNDIQATEVTVMAHPDNTDKIWVRTKKTATSSNAIPLNKWDTIKLTVTNLNQLHILITVDGEKAIVAYSI